MAPSPTPDERSDRLVFYPVALAGGIFCVTVCMTIASSFTQQETAGTKWLNKNGTSLLLWETAALVILCFLAMGIDRIRTKRKLTAGLQDRSEAQPEVPASEGGSHVG